MPFLASWMLASSSRSCSLQDLDDDADIQAARKGIQLFGRASHASYERVRPDGIVPGPRSSNIGQSRAASQRR